MLPTASPITWDNFNYTVVAVLAVIGFAGIYWLVSARKWFTGPEGPGLGGGTGRHRGGAVRLMAVARSRSRGGAGMLTLEELRAEADDGRDRHRRARLHRHAGPAAGQALSAEFFLDEVAEHDTEGCNYLLAVDVEMNTVDGYAMSSWERGYGDFVLVPDLATLRRLPLAAGTALVLADLTWLDGDAGGGLAAADPAPASCDRLAERGWSRWPAPSSSSSSTATATSRPAARGYRDLTPANQYNVDYSMLGTARIEPLLRRIRNGMAGAGLYVESAKGECNLGQHEIAFRYAEAHDHLRQPLDLQDRRQGDRGPGGHEHHVHGQAERARGQLLPHPPVAARRRRTTPGAGRATARTGCLAARRALPGRAAGRAARADPAATRRTSTPTSATSPGSFAPTAVRLGPGQPDLRAAGGRARPRRCGWRTGCPAAT